MFLGSDVDRLPSRFLCLGLSFPHRCACVRTQYVRALQQTGVSFLAAWREQLVRVEAQRDAAARSRRERARLPPHSLSNCTAPRSPPLRLCTARTQRGRPARDTNSPFFSPIQRRAPRARAREREAREHTRRHGVGRDGVPRRAPDAGPDGRLLDRLRHPHHGLRPHGGPHARPDVDGRARAQRAFGRFVFLGGG